MMLIYILGEMNKSYIERIYLNFRNFEDGSAIDFSFKDCIFYHTKVVLTENIHDTDDSKDRSLFDEVNRLHYFIILDFIEGLFVSF